MNVTECKAAVKTAVKSQVPIMLIGPGGVGKSAAVEQAAAEMGLPCRTIHASLLLLEDCTGILYEDSGQTRWARPEIFPDLDEKPGILFLDEISDASDGVQKALYQLLMTARVHTHAIPGWSIVMAGNRPEDSAISGTLPAPLITRMMHIGCGCTAPDYRDILPATAEVDGRGWAHWAAQSGISPYIIAFLQSYPDRLYHYQAVPRTWEILDRVLQIDDRPKSAIVSGIVGRETAGLYQSFIAAVDRLPDIREIAKSPTSTGVPVEIGERYLLSSILAGKADSGTFCAFLQYMERMERRLSVYFALLCSARPEIVALPEFISWRNRNQDLFA